VTQKTVAEYERERAALVRAIQPTNKILGGRAFVLLYNDATGGTGILSNIEDPEEIKAIVVSVAKMIATQAHDAVTVAGPDGEAKRA
jgi:hypothetical protein